MTSWLVEIVYSLRLADIVLAGGGAGQHLFLTPYPIRNKAVWLFVKTGVTATLLARGGR